MSFSQFVALLAFIATALPLGAIAMVAVLYGAIALGRVPVDAAMLFERHAGRVYCWAMVAILAAAILLIYGWSGRLLLLLVGASFLRAVLDLLPKLESLRAGAPVIAPDAVRTLARWRRIIAIGSALQWLAVLTVYTWQVL